MPITNVQPPVKPDDAYVWGYDTDAEKWVPVDRSMYEGSFIGNLGRAAKRGFESVYQGVREASTGQVDENLAARQAAAERAAPVAEAVGGFMPEAGAAALAGAATGGMGFLPTLAAESGAGGLVTALRPGTLEERLIGGLESAGLNVVGGAALKGIVQGFKIGRGILSATQSRVAAGVEAGTERAAANRAAAEAAAGETQPVGGSVGAAETPAGDITPEIARQTQAMGIDEAVGANIENPTARLAQSRAEELGWRPAPGSGTKAGSAQRLIEAGFDELNPFREQGELRRAFDNKRLMNQHVAKSLGIEDWKARDVITDHDLADVEGRLGLVYDQLDKETPGLSGREFTRVVSKSLKEGGFLDAGRVEATLQKAMERASEPGAKMTGEQTVDTLRQLKSMAMEAITRGDSHGAEILMEAQSRLQDAVETIAKRQGKEDLVTRLHTANQQWRIAQMVEAPGVLNPQGEINPLAMKRQMMRKRVRGGYGRAGPDFGRPERDVWNLVVTAAAEQTGVPMTGARALIGGAARTAIKGGIGLAGGGAVANALGLWD